MFVYIRDPHLAKRIMLNDFQYFHDRGVYCNEERDPLSSNLFALPGQRWKNLRARLTPTFTSGQLRNMMPTFLDVGKKLMAQMEKLVERETVLEMRAITSRFVLEIVASVYFGFEANCLENSDDPFRINLRRANSKGFVNNIRSAGLFICPTLLKITGISALSPQLIKFIMDLVKYQIDHREKNKITRKDFIQLLIDLRREVKDNVEHMTIEQCAANVFMFYFAGTESSTGAISFTLHELSHNPEVMTKLQQEIDEMLERNGGEITYENIKAMKYLDLCVKETLRKYPSLPILNRECTQDYRVPDSDVVIRKGVQVIIPLLGISMNEKYFPDPELYSPERFDEDTINHDPDAYYPFGTGPHNCIGLRQGVLVAKIGIILLLSKYNFRPSIPSKVKFASATISLAPDGGLPLKVERRN
uniref:Cytochrome P450 n=1 Tax=Anopheles sinensis TaxID=74873 RepID=A0A8K1UAY3_ANOSI|nr:cytochrome P450 [Anopheles sinensis]